jgi:hypothetical protein
MSGLKKNTWADDVKKCTHIIESCDKALQAQKEQIEVRDSTIKLQEEQTEALKDQVKAKESQLSNPVRNPVVLVGLGVIGTALAGPIVAGLGALVIAALFN